MLPLSRTHRLLANDNIDGALLLYPRMSNDGISQRPITSADRAAGMGGTGRSQAGTERGQGQGRHGHVMHIVRCGFCRPARNGDLNLRLCVCLSALV